MHKFLPILFWLWHFPAFTQANSVLPVVNKDTVANTTKNKGKKPEILTSGFIDIINSGQVNASARFIRLNIGEPGRFSIPLSLYGGVSNNTFQNTTPGTLLSKSNMHLVNEYINPLSGLINVSIEGVWLFGTDSKLTKPGLLYQVGERVLNGTRAGEISDPQTGKPVNFLNSFSSLGLYFQTGAWERNNETDIGIFWLTLRFHVCKSNPKQIKEFLSGITTNGFYYGYSAGFGIEINKLINIKAIYYKYLKSPEIEYGLPIYQFSFNYSLK